MDYLLSLVPGIYHSMTTLVLLLFIALMILAFLERSVQVTLAIAILLPVVFFLVPVRWLSLYEFVRSAIGPLSACFIVLCYFCAKSFWFQKEVVSQKDEFLFCTLVVFIGFVLYLTVLGFVPFEIYQAGFNGHGMAILMAFMLLVAFICHSFMTAAWVAGAVFLWFCGLIPSANVWDFLIDPIAWIGAMGIWIAHLANMVGLPIPYFGLRMCSRPSA